METKDKITHKEAGTSTETKHTRPYQNQTRSFFDFPGSAATFAFFGRPVPSDMYLGAAAGLGAEGLVPARAVDVVIAVPLELEQHHVGQAVGGIPAVLEPDRF